MNKKVLVIAAHPDDEVLGCGGTIALHSKNGDDVFTIIMCEGESLRYGSGNLGQDKAIECAGKILGVKKNYWLGFPDQRLDKFSLIELINPIEKIIKEVNPQIVYCQYGGDVNRDHEILFKAILVSTRPLNYSINGIYAFDTASSTEWGYPYTFNPDTWVDISSSLEQKIEAFKCYDSEVRKYPHPRSIEAIKNRAYAWGNRVCLKAAEVYMTIRRVIRDGQAPL